MATRSQVEGLFAALRRRKALDPEGPLLWGYYFVDPDAERLQQAADELAGAGYEFVEIFQDDADVAAGEWRLHLVREERHTVDSLDGRNAQLRAFAEQRGLARFDGNDVGATG